MGWRGAAMLPIRGEYADRIQPGHLTLSLYSDDCGLHLLADDPLQAAQVCTKRGGFHPRTEICRKLRINSAINTENHSNFNFT